MSRGSSRGSSHRSSSITLPRAGSSLTTSPTPRVWVPRHVALLVSLLVVDYFTYTARLDFLREFLADGPKHSFEIIDISDLVSSILLQPGKDFFEPCLDFL
jgi:hypothetical protein